MIIPIGNLYDDHPWFGKGSLPERDELCFQVFLRNYFIVGTQALRWDGAWIPCEIGEVHSQMDKIWPSLNKVDRRLFYRTFQRSLKEISYFPVPSMEVGVTIYKASSYLDRITPPWKYPRLPFRRHEIPKTGPKLSSSSDVSEALSSEFDFVPEITREQRHLEYRMWRGFKISKGDINCVNRRIWLPPEVDHPMPLSTGLINGVECYICTHEPYWVNEQAMDAFCELYGTSWAVSDRSAHAPGSTKLVEIATPR